eukprot:g378.t1
MRGAKPRQQAKIVPSPQSKKRRRSLLPPLKGLPRTLPPLKGVTRTHPRASAAERQARTRARLEQNRQTRRAYEANVNAAVKATARNPGDKNRPKAGGSPEAKKAILKPNAKLKAKWQKAGVAVLTASEMDKRRKAKTRQVQERMYETQNERMSKRATQAIEELNVSREKHKKVRDDLQSRKMVAGRVKEANAESGAASFTMQAPKVVSGVQQAEERRARGEQHHDVTKGRRLSLILVKEAARMHHCVLNWVIGCAVIAGIIVGLVIAFWPEEDTSTLSPTSAPTRLPAHHCDDGTHYCWNASSTLGLEAWCIKLDTFQHYACLCPDDTYETKVHYDQYIAETNEELRHQCARNSFGHLLGHVCDHGEDPNNKATRVYRTSRRQRFHTDSCDVVGLLCLKQAQSGGRSSIVSSVTVYEEMKQRRPDLLALMEANWYWDRKGEIPAGKREFYLGPVVNHHCGKVLSIYDRNFFTTCDRFEGVPPLTARQVEALDLYEELAESEALRLDMDFQPGDIQLLHNHQILHSRSAFVDYDEPERRRHLLRLWLSVNDGWELPPVYLDGRYRAVRRGEVRGGIEVPPGVALKVPLQPE